MTLIRRQQQRHRQRPAMRVPLRDQVRRLSELLRGLCQRERYAVDRQAYVRRSIVLLFMLRGPSTILFRVRPVIVWEAIQRMIGRRARPHIAQEGVERSHPRLTHGNASSAVARIAWLARISAALLHAVPRRTFLCGSNSLAAPRMPMHEITAAHRLRAFTIETAAAFRITGAQINAPNHAEFAARAATVPRDTTAFRWCSA